MANAAGDFLSKQVYHSEETELLLGSINRKCDLRVKVPLLSDRCSISKPNAISAISSASLRLWILETLSKFSPISTFLVCLTPWSFFILPWPCRTHSKALGLCPQSIYTLSLFLITLILCVMVDGRLARLINFKTVYLHPLQVVRTHLPMRTKWIVAWNHSGLDIRALLNDEVFS